MAEQRHTSAEKNAPCYLSVVSSAHRSRSRLLELLTWLRDEVRGYGWKQVAACFALSDQPGQLLEVYQLPEGKSLLPTLEALERRPNYQALTHLCKSRQMELTYGLPYDPGAGAPSGQEVDYPRRHFLQAILTLKTAQQDTFIGLMHQVREFFFKNEWSLVSASQSFTPPYRVMHLWRFGDADELGELMREISAEESYEKLDRCCERQWQRLLFEPEPPNS